MRTQGLAALQPATHPPPQPEAGPAAQPALVPAATQQAAGSPLFASGGDHTSVLSIPVLSNPAAPDPLPIGLASLAAVASAATVAANPAAPDPLPIGLASLAAVAAAAANPAAPDPLPTGLDSLAAAASAAAASSKPAPRASSRRPQSSSQPRLWLQDDWHQPQSDAILALVTGMAWGKAHHFALEPGLHERRTCLKMGATQYWYLLASSKSGCKDGVRLQGPFASQALAEAAVSPWVRRAGKKGGEEGKKQRGGCGASGWDGSGGDASGGDAAGDAGDGAGGGDSLMAEAAEGAEEQYPPELMPEAMEAEDEEETVEQMDAAQVQVQETMSEAISEEATDEDSSMPHRQPHRQPKTVNTKEQEEEAFLDELLLRFADQNASSDGCGVGHDGGIPSSDQRDGGAATGSEDRDGGGVGRDGPGGGGCGEDDGAHHICALHAELPKGCTSQQHRCATTVATQPLCQPCSQPGGFASHATSQAARSAGLRKAPAEKREQGAQVQSQTCSGAQTHIRACCQPRIWACPHPRRQTHT